MEPPARLPATEDELADWTVYADWLLTRGDPLGELLAIELALPAAPDRAQVAAFQAAARRRCRERARRPAGWCLGHVRTLELLAWRTMRSPQPPDHGLLANARDLLRTDAGARLEALSVQLGIYDGAKPWRRLFEALPASCRRVRVELSEWTEREAALLSAALPATVRELGVARFPRRGAAPPEPERFVTDRFDVVDLGLLEVTAALADRLALALERSRAVRVRVGRISAARLPAGRWELGAPGDAALLDPVRRHAMQLPRWNLRMRQQRYGLLPVRAQLAATLPEDHTLEPLARAPGRDGYSNHLVRRGDAWTLRRDEIELRHNGALLPPAVIVPLADGDRIGIGETELVFVARDVTQRAAELLDK